MSKPVATPADNGTWLVRDVIGTRRQLSVLIDQAAAHPDPKGAGEDALRIVEQAIRVHEQAWPVDAGMFTRGDRIQATRLVEHAIAEASKRNSERHGAAWAKRILIDARPEAHGLVELRAEQWWAAGMPEDGKVEQEARRITREANERRDNELGRKADKIDDATLEAVATLTATDIRSRARALAAAEREGRGTVRYTRAMASDLDRGRGEYIGDGVPRTAGGLPYTPLDTPDRAAKRTREGTMRSIEHRAARRRRQ